MTRDNAERAAEMAAAKAAGEQCPDCGIGDARYSAPGRGHREGCTYPAGGSEPSPSALWPHFPIVGHPKHDYYICGSCHQPLGPGPCPAKMPTQPSPPTFDSLLSDPTQQLDPEGVVIKSMPAEPGAGDVEALSGMLLPHLHAECDELDAAVLAVVVLSSDWLANHGRIAHAQGRAEGVREALREGADELWRVFLRLPRTPSPIGDYVQRRMIALRERADQVV